MDYIGYECPVCKKPFHAYEDIVVCPECGTPHHRECYLQEGHCHFEEKHGAGFDFNKNAENVFKSSDVSGKRCARCGTENSSDSLYCRQCGSPMQNDAQNVYGQQQAPPPPFNPFGGQGVDSTAFIGFNPQEEVAEGVTAEDVGKFVKNSAPYYTKIFLNIKRYARSRFNFAAFLFSGGFLLYRKQYKLGALITAIIAVLMLFQNLIYFSDTYSSVSAQLLNEANSAFGSFDLFSIYSSVEKLSSYQLFIFYLPTVLQLIQYVVMFVVGFNANKYYCKYCVKEIRQIKSTAKNQAEIDEAFQSKGGVNTALGISLFALYLVLNYLPYLFL